MNGNARMPDARIRAVAIAAVLAIVPSGCELLDPDEDVAQDQILFIGGATGGKDIYRMNADGSGVVNLTRSPDGYRSLDITPDGRTAISVSSSGAFKIWDLQAKTERDARPESVRGISGLALMPSATQSL